MKRLMVLALALGLVSATAFAYGFGIPDSSVYEQEDQEAAYRQQQQQIQLYYQQQVLAAQANAQAYLLQTGINDLAAGKDTDAARLVKEQYTSQQPKQEDQGQVPAYQKAYREIMAANQNRYVAENGSKVMESYYKQLAEIQGKTAVAGAQDDLANAQYNNKMNSIARKSQTDAARCNSSMRNPVDNFLCADMDYANYMHSVGRQEYEMQKRLSNWLAI